MVTVPKELKDQMAAKHYKEICELLVKLADKENPPVVTLRKSGDNYILAVSAHQYADAGKKKPQPVQMNMSTPDKLSADFPKMLKELINLPDPVEEKPEAPKDKKTPVKEADTKKPGKTKPKDETPELPLEENEAAPVSSGWTF